MHRSDIEVRRATYQDLLAVYDIEANSFSDPFPFSFFKRMLLMASQTFLVATHDGGVAGYAVASIENGAGHILSIAVEPAKRRRGIGAALTRELSNVLLRQDISQLRLEVRRGNSTARAFYESLGFMHGEIAKGYYPDGEDALVMVRNSDVINDAHRGSRQRAGAH